MEIVIGYALGAFVLVLFFISVVKMISSRLNKELNKKIDSLEKRVEDLESK
ncbi:hypothetical protein SAMN04487943_11137 [Gracilibacillus orientalis]|uniref:Uncharacterized protein n=1 Tax=Gracilibacillus orientalis TaxID=334253 RepID=A0A1I4PF21_9BACI|nr:hypothetical protein [Gracilibacillus orientalis]SFM26372.1 hypothetical protein SAMN04487943_11137 [Gracilibacillus orientalis]